ncbi:radical SAM protein [Planctomycetota bacterium]
MDETIIKPQIMAFEVTGKCQFHCRHCRANAECTPTGELTTDQCKQILFALANYAKCMVIFTGGEPLERPDIFELLDHTQSLGLGSVMATCGYLIDKDMIKRLQEAKVMALSFSLDGSSAETHDLFRQAKGAFNAVLKATELARAAGMRFQINTTLSRINKHEVIAISAMAERMGAACFNPFILVPTGRGEELSDQLLDPVEYETLLNELLKIKINSSIPMRVTCGPQFARITRTRAEERVDAAPGCMGGREFGFISRQGVVQTCGFLQISAGNLLENGYDFRQIWEESHFLEEIRDREHYSGKCSMCAYMDTCGGCRARAFAASGDYLGNDPLCSS